MSDTTSITPRRAKDATSAATSAPGSPDTNSDAKPPRSWKATLARITNTTWLTSLLAVVVALVVGAILIAAADSGVQASAKYLFARPGDFFGALGHSVGGAYASLFQGAVFNISSSYTVADFVHPLTNTVSYSVPLIFAGLALGIGFRAGLFNIGAQGQIVMGATLSAFVGFTWHLPPGLHLIACLLAAFIGGAIWGFVPGILKALTGANEVIVTIMLNSVAVYLLSYLLTLPAFRSPGSFMPISPAVDASARFPHFFGSAIDLGFVLALVAAFAVWWLMERSTLGFRIRAVGESNDAARTAGMSVPAAYVWVMVIAGGLAGLASTSQLLSGSSQQLNGDIASTFGFDAITVALLGRSKPVGTVLAGLLFGGLRAGGYIMQSSTGTPIDIILVLQSVIVLLIAAPPLVRAIFRLPDPDKRAKVKTSRRHEVATVAATQPIATVESTAAAQPVGAVASEEVVESDSPGEAPTDAGPGDTDDTVLAPSETEAQS
ncbi:MAG: ABC transporter permease [Propionibacteriaceae bacterium]|jgi:simple sugar transport system permease protein|nr:ABC transporter permease [Propionibacteriaceae bacterium]